MQPKLSDHPTLLVTGASGVLGWTLSRLAAAHWHTVGTVYRHQQTPPGVEAYPVDLTDNRAIAECFATVKPAAVIHVAALSNANDCQTHPQASEAVNVTAAVGIAARCADDAIPCVFTSTDLVFDGKHAPYTEDDPPHPVSIYGDHKRHAEIALRERYPEITICRLPLLFGPASPAYDGALMRMLQAMRKGNPLRLFIDEFRTPVSTETAAEGLLNALAQAPGETLHLGGPERLSRWELGMLTAECFGIDKPPLVPRPQADVHTLAPRPADVSLDSSRAAHTIGYCPKSVREQLDRIRKYIQPGAPSGP